MCLKQGRARTLKNVDTAPCADAQSEHTADSCTFKCFSAHLAVVGQLYFAAHLYEGASWPGQVLPGWRNTGDVP